MPSRCVPMMYTVDNILISFSVIIRVNLFYSIMVFRNLLKLFDTSLKLLISCYDLGLVSSGTTSPLPLLSGVSLNLLL